MKLAAWLDGTKTPDNEFATRIGVSRVTLYRFKVGARIPDPKTMARIGVETSGSVTPNDFYDANLPIAVGE